MGDVNDWNVRNVGVVLTCRVITDVLSQSFTAGCVLKKTIRSNGCREVFIIISPQHDVDIYPVKGLRSKRTITDGHKKGIKS